MQRDRYPDTVHWNEQALSKPGGDPALRARTLCTQAWALWPVGRRGEQAAVIAQAEALSRALPDTAILAKVLYSRTVQESWDGQLDAVATLADEAAACAQATGDEWVIAMAAHASATAAGSAAELRDRVDKAASLLEAVGNVYHLADLFHMATYRALVHGCDRDASEFADRATPLVRELNQPYLWMLLRGKAGLAALLSGDTEAARKAFREQLTLCRELVVLPAAFEGVAGLAAVAVVRDDLDRAARLTGAAAAHRYGETHDAVDARLNATFFKPARMRCGADAWDAAYRQGAALNFDDAIAYALNE